ncbi:MAG: hypothetical protein AAGF91_09040 [Actinomycetota bacterium]
MKGRRDEMAESTRWSVSGDTGPEPEIVLHLGAHKTGTTSLQRALRDSTDDLAAAGWVFQGKRVGPLRSVFSVVHDRHGLPRSTASPSASDDELVDRLRTEVGAILASGRRLVVSDETLFGQPGVRRGLYPDADRVADVVGRAFEGMSVLPVLVIRRQPEFLESWYVQTVKQGGGRTFDEFLESIDLDSVSWTTYARRLSEWLGVDPLLVAYEWLGSREGGVIGWFFERLGLAWAPGDGDLDLNSGFSESALLIALAAHPHLDRDQRAGLRRFLERNVSDRSAHRPRLLSDVGRRHIVDVLSDDNAQCFDSGVVADSAVRARYVGSADGDEPIDGPPYHEQWPAVREALRGWIEASVDAMSPDTPT